MRFNSTLLGVAAASAFIAGSTASAQTVIMDGLADGDIAAPLEVDYDLATAGIQGIGATSNDFSGGGDFSQFDSNGLFLASDAIKITFDLAAGQFIQDFGVTGDDFVGGQGGTTITFTGTEVGGGATSETISINQSGPFNVGTFQPGLAGQPATDFASIDSVEITSFEGVLTQFDYTIVPAPSSAAGLALAGCLFTRRRRTA